LLLILSSSRSLAFFTGRGFRVDINNSAQELRDNCITRFLACGIDLFQFLGDLLIGGVLGGFVASSVLWFEMC
jgi:hypothetical protein